MDMDNKIFFENIVFRRFLALLPAQRANDERCQIYGLRWEITSPPLGNPLKMQKRRFISFLNMFRSMIEHLVNISSQQLGLELFSILNINLVISQKMYIKVPSKL